MTRSMVLLAVMSAALAPSPAAAQGDPTEGAVRAAKREVKAAKREVGKAATGALREAEKAAGEALRQGEREASKVLDTSEASKATKQLGREARALLKGVKQTAEEAEEAAQGAREEAQKSRALVAGLGSVLERHRVWIELQQVYASPEEIPRQVRRELRDHGRRTAMLRRAGELAGAAGDQQNVTRAEALLSREMARHAREMTRLIGRAYSPPRLTPSSGDAQ